MHSGWRSVLIWEYTSTFDYLLILYMVFFMNIILFLSNINSRKLSFILKSRLFWLWTIKNSFLLEKKEFSS